MWSWGISVGCSATHPSSHCSGHSPGRGRQLSLCTHQPKAPGHRGGVVGLLKARHAWQSPSRRPRPRQLAAGHCKERMGEGSVSTGAQGNRKGLQIQGSWVQGARKLENGELKAGLECKDQKQALGSPEQSHRLKGSGWWGGKGSRISRKAGTRILGVKISLPVRGRSLTTWFKYREAEGVSL